MPKRKNSPTLIDILLARELISSEQAKSLVREAQADGQPLEDILLKRDLIASKDLYSAKSELYNMPYVDLTDRNIPLDVIKLIPQEIAENYQIVLFEHNEKEVSVALVNPGNYKAIEAIEFIAREHNWKVHYFVTSQDSFINGIKRYGSLKSEVKAALTLAEDKFQGKNELKPSDAESEDSGKLEEVVKAAPVAKMVAVILRHAVEGGASDIHIEPMEGDSRVRFRIDGILHTSIVLPRYIHSAIISRVKILANMRIDETRTPQDGRIRVIVSGRPIDLRVSTMPLLSSEKVVMRILDVSTGLKTLEELGFWGNTLKLIQEGLKKAQGMFLVTGPTGSGKSTTLYAALNILNEEGVNIITLEDPIEYYLLGVNQSQVNPDAGYTFASGLRSILRQDPDIILVGEIRDTETAELAIHAALTGHVMLSTLHTNDAFGAITRLVDMHIEPFLLASTLNIVVAQRLVRKVCRFCSQEVKVPDNLLAQMKTELNLLPADVKATALNDKWVFKRGAGCNRCDFTGYHGRTVIAESLANTPQLQAILSVGPNYQAIRDEAHRQGMVSMKQDGLLKVLQGLTTLEEVLTATND